MTREPPWAAVITDARHAAPDPPAEVWPLDDPADLNAALGGLAELVRYLAAAAASPAGSVDAAALDTTLGALTEATTVLPAVADRLADRAAQLGQDPTLRHREAHRGNRPADTITAIRTYLAQARVAAERLHGLLAGTRALCGDLTHDQVEPVEVDR